MSRIGKKPVTIPSGVTAQIENGTLTVKGPKGTLAIGTDELVKYNLDDGNISILPANDSQTARSHWGLQRTLVSNLVEGVTKGFEKKLEITGVGYRAALQGKNLQLSLGYSHDVIYPVPEGITITVPKPTEITVAGNDAQRVGQVAAEIRGYRPPEPYKGKGVKYVDEFIFRKEGKKK